jgi:hypothetical protein
MLIILCTVMGFLEEESHAFAKLAQLVSMVLNNLFAHQ